MSVTLVANYIAKLDTEFDWVLFEASLKSIRAACDKIKVVWAPNDSDDWKEGIPCPERLTQLWKQFDFQLIEVHGKVKSFAEIRNKALAEVREGEFFYWIDSDEVAFSSDLVQLKNRLDSWIRDGRNVTSIRTRFIHFCLDPHYYERTEPRTTIMLKGPETRWEGAVHERVMGIPKGIELDADYFVHHYGYCKPQQEVFRHWQHYAELEGDPNRYINEEVEGKTVPYFRPGDRPTPSNILDDRRKVLVPYFGEYPDLSVLKYLEDHCNAH